jgi:NDP-sugar pyrophosphorylase family protein
MTQALVLAAGLGSRIRSVSGDLPKPLMPFGGEPILVGNLRWLADSGVTDVWINLHFGAEPIRQTIGDGSSLGLSVRYIFEPELLGTAGALGNIRQEVTGPIFVVYGDSVVRCSLDALAARHHAQAAEVTIALFDRDRHAHTGIAGGRVKLGTDGSVDGFVEGAGDSNAYPLVNAGVYLVNPSVLDLIPPGFSDFGRDIFPAMLGAGGRLYGHVMEDDGFCLGLDTPESHATGLALLEQGRLVL